jgi:hypothetical protein
MSLFSLVPPGTLVLFNVDRCSEKYNIKSAVKRKSMKSPMAALAL